MKRRIHPTNCGRVSGLVALGLEGTSIFWMAASIGLSILIFLLLFAALNLGFLLSVFAAILPASGTLAVILNLVRGKPVGYLSEYWEWIDLRAGIVLGSPRCHFFEGDTGLKHPFLR